MAKIRNRRLFVTPPNAPDVVGYDWYHELASADNAQFLGDADNGNAANEPVRTTAPQYFPDLPEADYQFCVIVVDDAGNESDPFQHPGWVNVPLDVTPPPAASVGGIDFGAG
ncbi:MAG: hypothetical protein ACR2PR_11685 [Pseudohongiellaceae bacterium]